MFIKLYRKIYYSLFFICLALVAVFDVLAVVVEITTLNDTYRTMGQARVDRIVNSCRLYIRSVETTTENLSVDAALIAELSAPTGVSMTNKLDDTCNYSLKINAITAYALDGSAYSSSKVSEVPSLASFYEIEDIAAFLQGDEESYLSLRTHTIANIYSTSLYPKEMGVITCCRKVYNGDRVVGYLFTDILPANLYAYVYGDEQINDAVPFITFPYGYFSYDNNALQEELLNVQKPSGYFRFSEQINEGLSIVIFESKSEYTMQILTLCGIIALCTILLVILLHYLAKNTAKSVTNRLDRFLNRMQSENLLV